MPFVDARELPDGHRIEADLCIVGAGAAGLAIASELVGGPLRVALLESGGLEPDPASQDLNRGEIVGHPHAPLEASALRQFGGTTNHWTAFVRPLTPIAFEPRPWLEHGGWPLRAADLASYGERAARFLGLPPRPFDVSAWDAGAPAWRFASGRVVTQVTQIVAESRRRLGPVAREWIEKATNTSVHLFANALELRTDPDRRRVLEARVGTLGGKRFAARARAFVLAAGGIGNARLLLLSSSVQAAGLANENDLVGRFYANHPEALVGELLTGNPRARAALYTMRPHAAGHAVGVLSLSEAVEREAELPNVEFRVVPTALDPGSAPGFQASLGRVTRAMDGGSPAGRPPRLSLFRLKAVAEPAPNPASRVTLGDARDAFGQRRARLDWRLSDRDAAGIHRALAVFAREVGAAGIGRVRPTFPPALGAITGLGSFHQMGTTRMHADPKRGVVDADCRAHGLANLFVAGSSVFPTYGAVNPTFTLIALALRLADRLRAAPDRAP
jgi:choline dehydrogenase-like flavoprotein